MQEIPQAIPDVDVLLRLEPEELGATILFLLRRRNETQFHPNNLLHEMWRNNHLPGEQSCYPQSKRVLVDEAFAEAWTWLEVQGLLVPTANLGSSNGWRKLSRRAIKFESEAQFANYAVARALPKEALHPKIATTVWMAFMRGEFDVAVLQVMKAVEVAVREAAGLPQKEIGVNLMRQAFNPAKGKLRDKKAQPAEQEALMALFAGAIGSYKNPHSHRDVQLKDPAEAVEIIMLANHLLRIVDARVKAKQRKNKS